MTDPAPVPELRTRDERATDADPTSFDEAWPAAAVLICRGPLDLSVRVELRDALAALLRAEPDHLVVDLDAVTFVDCSALGELVSARNALRETGRVITLRRPSPAVRRLLRTVGLADLEDPTWPIDAPAADQLRAVSRDRVAFEQATGIVAEHFDLGVDAAATVIREFCAAEQQSETTLATALVERTRRAEELAAYAPAGGASIPPGRAPR